MSSTAGSPCTELKEGDLQTLLLQRDFDKEQTSPHDGGRRFLEFPGEVRNEIYKLVGEYVIQETDSRARQAIYLRQTDSSKKDKSPIHERNSQLYILQPGLFVSSKQIRTEGLPFFYQMHHFDLSLDPEHSSLDLPYGIAQPALSRWLQAIGEFGQQNIRHLTLRDGAALDCIECIEHIHQRLSEKATVSYEARDFRFAEALWRIRSSYQSKDKKKVPLFFNQGVPRALCKFDAFSFGVRNCKLEFPAGFGWFGMAQDDKAQLSYQRDKPVGKPDKEPRGRQVQERKRSAAQEWAGRMNEPAPVEEDAFDTDLDGNLILEGSDPKGGEMENWLEEAGGKGKHEFPIPVAIADHS